MVPQTIVYLHPHFTLHGGAGTFVLETGQRLAQRGHRVIVVSIAAQASVVRSYKSSLTFISIGGPLSSSIWFWLSFPVVLFKVFRVLDQYPEAVIFPQVFPANWWGFLYKLCHPKRRVAWMCQEPSAFLHSQAWIRSLPLSVAKLGLLIALPLLKFIDVKLADYCDIVFCNSKFTLKQARKVYGYTPSKALTLYLGADLKTFRPQKLKRQLKIVTVGRLTKFKRIDVILRALKLLNHGRSRHVHLTIIGEGEARAELTALVTKLELETAVTFLGQTPDVKCVVKELSTAKALVQASINEPFGLAPIEAMACGTPAVVSDSGGMTETVLNGKTGYHFKGGDAADLSRKLARLVDDEKLFKQLSTAATQRAKVFNWDQTVTTIETVLSQRLPS